VQRKGLRAQNFIVYLNFFVQISVFTFNLMCRFVEIMATVFSRDAWRCVWHMIQVEWHYMFNFNIVYNSGILTHCLLQNDLVHGWGLDFALRKCVEVLFVCSFPMK
jgi:hypothetical protein